MGNKRYKSRSVTKQVWWFCRLNLLENQKLGNVTCESVVCVKLFHRQHSEAYTFRTVGALRSAVERKYGREEMEGASVLSTPFLPSRISAQLRYIIISPFPGTYTRRTWNLDIPTNPVENSRSSHAQPGRAQAVKVSV